MAINILVMMEQDLLNLSEHLRLPLFFDGVRVAYSLVFYVVMCTFVCLLVFMIFSHGVVILFSIYEFDCPSGIVRPSFMTEVVSSKRCAISGRQGITFPKEIHKFIV